MKATKHFCFHYYSLILIKQKIKIFKTGNTVYPNFAVIERNIMKSKSCSWKEHFSFLFSDPNSYAVYKVSPNLYLLFYILLTFYKSRCHTKLYSALNLNKTCHCTQKDKLCPYSSNKWNSYHWRWPVFHNVYTYHDIQQQTCRQPQWNSQIYGRYVNSLEMEWKGWDPY